MKQRTHPYYRDQLAFLLEGGRAMSQKHPRDADQLAQRGNDPDVERILEGIAFIVGKITEKQVEILPELAQFLLDVLFPHYLCPVPAASVLELTSADWAETIPAGTEVFSEPVRGTPCCFRTTYEVDTGPLQVASASFTLLGVGGDLRLHFSGLPADRLAELAAARDRIRIHLHGEPLVTTTLYHWLMTKLEAVDLVDEQDRIVAPAPRISAAPLGFADEEALLLYPDGTFPGFRLLQEYFTLPQKFLFVELRGVFETLKERGHASDSFGLSFHLRLENPRSLLVDRRHFRLGCTPAVNLFEHTADPVIRTPGHAEYRVRPSGADRHFEIYRVLDAQCISRKGTVRYPILSELDLGASRTFSQVHRRICERGDVQVYLSLNDTDDSLPLLPGEQTLLVDLICSNGDLASALRVGDINRMRQPYEHVKCRSIVAVTPPVPVPLGEDLRQRLVCHLGLTQTELDSRRGLRDSIDLYNLQATVDRQAHRALALILEGLLSVRSEGRRIRHKGLPIFGKSIFIELGDAAFASEGELFLFGSIINEFVALQSPVNWFSELTLRWAKTKVEYQWPRRMGRELLSS